MPPFRCPMSAITTFRIDASTMMESTQRRRARLSGGEGDVLHMFCDESKRPTFLLVAGGRLCPAADPPAAASIADCSCPAKIAIPSPRSATRENLGPGH